MGKPPGTALGAPGLRWDEVPPAAKKTIDLEGELIN
jgi:hypothetical protein